MCYKQPTRDVFGAGPGPGQVVRLWDPRAELPVQKLLGHTDNIRALVLDDDGTLVRRAPADLSFTIFVALSLRC